MIIIQHKKFDDIEAGSEISKGIVINV